MHTRDNLLVAFCGVALMTVAPERADINIGIILGTTGPTASAGLPYKTVFSNVPDTVAGQKVHYIIVDDAGDPTPIPS